MKHIDNIFQEELGNYTETPPPMVWDALEKRLEGDRGKRPFPLRWMWYCTVISMVLVVSGSLAWKMANTGSETAPVAETGAPVALNEKAAGNNSAATADIKTIALNSANNNTKATKTETAVKHTKTHKTHTTPGQAVAVKKATGSGIAHTRSHTHTAAHAENKVAHESVAKNTSDAANSEYDYYAAATSGDNDGAALPKAKTDVDGYTVNVRTKNRIKVADMTPVDEKPVYRKRVEATSSENMVVSTIPATNDAQNEKPARKAGNATANSHKATAVAHKTAGSAATSEARATASAPVATASAKANTSKSVEAKATEPKAHEVKPVASTKKANIEKSVVANTKSVKVATTTEQKAHEAKASASVPVASSAKAIAANPVATKTVKAETPAVKKAQPAELAAATPAKAATPIVHKVTSPAETTKNENRPAVSKKDVATKPAVVKKATAKQPAATPATRPAAEKPIACKPDPTGKKAAAATEKKVTAAQPAINKEEVNKPIAAIIPSASARTGKPAKQTKAITASEVAGKPAVKEKLGKKTAEIKQPATIQPTATVSLEKDVKMAEPAKEEPAAIAKEAATEKAIATADKKEAKKTTAKKATETTTTANNTNKTAQPKTFEAAAANTSAARKYKPSLFVEDPANIGMDEFFAAAVMHKTGEAPLPGTFKNPQPANPLQQPAPALTAQPVATVDSNTAKPSWKTKVTGGIKLGLEGTYSSDGARRAVVSPYLEYQLSNKTSFLFQPAIKLSNLSKRDLGGAQTYFKVNDDGKATLSNTDPWLIPRSGGGFDTIYQRTYTYTQSHDSIVKSYNIGGTYFDFDVPLLMKYNLTRKFSVYGGVNLAFHKIGINTNTYNSGPITVTHDSFTIAASTAPTPTPPPVSSVIKYGNTPLKEPGNPYTQPNGEFNIGYMFGISYEFRRRCLFDALIQQTFARANNVGASTGTTNVTGYDINKAFSLPYLRLTLGYRLMK